MNKVTFSQGTIRKRQMSDGSWQWQVCVNRTEDGKRQQLRKNTGIPCEPQKASEKGSGRRIQATGKGARQAQAILNEWRAKLIADEEAKATMAARNAQSVLEFCEAYWSTKTDVADNTRKEFRKAKNHIQHQRLDMSISNLKAEAVQDWLDIKTSEGCGKTALKKAFIQLKAACAWGVRMGYINRNPCDPITAPRPDTRPKNPLDDEAIAQLNTALNNLRAANGSMRRCVADAASLAMLTGMREGEVCGLSWNDIDGGTDGTMTENGYIHVRNVIVDASGGAQLKPYPKSRKHRDIPMNKDILKLLKDRRELFVAIEGNDLTGCYVIARPETAHKFMSNGYLCHRWSDFIAMTGIKGMEDLTPVFHDLRHTFATQAIAHDVDIVSVSAFMGHASPTITLNIYARWTKRAKADAMARLDGVFS